MRMRGGNSERQAREIDERIPFREFAVKIAPVCKRTKKLDGHAHLLHALFEGDIPERAAGETAVSGAEGSPGSRFRMKL